METSTLPAPASIPSRRRRWLKRAGWGVVWLFTLAMLAREIENWRGRKAWEAYVAGMEAKGERFDLESVLPPPVPDAENFARAPIFEPLSDYKQDSPPSALHGRDEKVAQVVKTIHAAPPFRNEKAVNALKEIKVRPTGEAPIGNWRKGTASNLQILADAYRKDSSYPHAPEQSTPAEEVLMALTKYDKEYAGFRDACARPKSRFPLRYEDNVAMPMPHLQVLLNFAKLAQTRALAELALGKVDAAFADENMIFRAGEAIQDEPVLIALLVRVSILEVGMQPLWEGMVRHQWTDEQLRTFDERLASVNLAAHCRNGIRGERNLFGFLVMDILKLHPQELYVFMAVNDGTGKSNPVALAMYLLPTGWWDQNKVAMGYAYEQMLETVDSNAMRFYPERLSSQVESHSFAPYTKFADMLTPAATTVETRSAFTQGTVNLARIAVALERHWLKHGNYPPDLASLDADAKPAGGSFPLDPATGRAAHYTPADGRFLLYFEGWNQKDDGGQIVWSEPKSGRADPQNGDWVWPSGIAP